VQALSDDDEARLSARGVAIERGRVHRLVVVDDLLRGIQVDDRVVARTAVFVRPGHRSRSDLAASLGCETDADGLAVVDRTGRTSVDRVWAAGNATNPRAQVITAAGEGSAAAIAINNDLVDEDVAAAAALHN
jgi:thioredoxin reductase